MTRSSPAADRRAPRSVPLTAGTSRGLDRAFKTCASGVRIFGRDELTAGLADRGLAAVEQRVAGVAQFVSAHKPTRGGVVPS